MPSAARKSPVVRMRVPRKANEDKIQASIVNAYRRLFDCLVFAIPNGGNRNEREAAKMKWTGTLAGVPDVKIEVDQYFHFYIECKDPSEIQARERDVPTHERFHSLSDSQKNVVPGIRERGITVYVVCSLDEAMAAAEHAGLAPRHAPIRSVAEATTGF